MAEHVRGLPRPRRAAGDRPAHPRRGGPRWPPGCARAAWRSRTCRSSTRSPRVVPGRAGEVVAAAAARGVNLRLVDADRVGISCDETTIDAHLRAVWEAFGVPAVHRSVPVRIAGGIDPRVATSSPIRCSPRHHSETAMLRYLRRLADRDYALDRGMIPLGSCTMKLNATTEMEPVSWPEFADIHPFAPAVADRGLRGAGRARWRAGWPRSPATTRSPCSPTPARRASWPACWRSGRTTARAATTDRDVCLIPSVGARHQRGQRGDGRHAGGRGGLRRRRQRRPGRPRRQDRGARATRSPRSW